MDLISKKCVPCSIDTPPIKREVAQKMLRELNGRSTMSFVLSLVFAKVGAKIKPKINWNLTDENGILRIKKDFKFKDFKEALEFVNKVGEIAELERHHPNINLHNWNRVAVENFTHKIKGLSENDFILAAKINAI